MDANDFIEANRGPLKAIDSTFDFRSDTPPGKDPDARSPTLRRYHQLLWSKPLLAVRRSSSTSPLRARICTTAPSSASSSCRAIP